MSGPQRRRARHLQGERQRVPRSGATGWNISSQRPDASVAVHVVPVMGAAPPGSRQLPHTVAGAFKQLVPDCPRQTQLKPWTKVVGGSRRAMRKSDRAAAKPLVVTRAATQCGSLSKSAAAGFVDTEIRCFWNWTVGMQRRRFSREFKLEAVRLVKDRGVAVAQACRDLDLHENVLRKWIRELSTDPQHAFPATAR